MLFRTFALNEDAFARECDRRFVFPSKPFRDVYARLLHEIEAGSGALLLIGAPGVGKTTLLRQLGENLEAWRWSVRWGAVPVAAGQTALDRPDGGADGEAAKPAAGSPPRPTAVIVDAADDLTNAALQQICCSAMNHRPAEVLLLAGTEALVDKLACSPHGFAFRLIRMRCLPREDIQSYVRHRLTTAGSTGPDVFTPPALEVLAEYSRGIPGTINRIAVASLLLADVEGLKRVDADLVHEAAGDLGIGDPTIRTSPAPSLLPSERRSGGGDGPVSAVPRKENSTVIRHDIAGGGAGSAIPAPALGSRRGAMHRWRLGAAGLAGVAVLAASLAYLWGESRLPWRSPDVASEALQPATDTSLQAAGARNASASSGDAVSSSMSSEKPDSVPGSQRADRETSAMEPQQAGDEPPQKSMSSAELVDDALGEGDALTARGDIAAARLYYALASQHGSSEATRKLAQSYDPLFLQGAQVSGLRPDVGKAIGAYSAAAASGDREAANRLTALLHEGGDGPR